MTNIIKRAGICLVFLCGFGASTPALAHHDSCTRNEDCPPGHYCTPWLLCDEKDPNAEPYQDTSSPSDESGDGGCLTDADCAQYEKCNFTSGLCEPSYG
jgi:hypothetical protein